MLAGEYAVLDGCRSLAFTVDRFLELDAQKSQSDCYRVASSIWPQAETFTDLSLKTNPLLDAVYYASSGVYYDVNVDSELRIEDGMGSSSALRLAAFSALSSAEEKHRFVRDWSNSTQIARGAYDRQLKDQGSASGYDIMTQLHGGLVVMEGKKEPWPSDCYRAKAVDFSDWVHIIVGGKGAPTQSQMGSTSKWLKENNQWEKLKVLSEELVTQMLDFFACPSEQSFSDLVRKISSHRNIFKNSPKFPTELSQLLESLDGFESDWTFKTTGAGGEDAILLFGKKHIIDAVVERVEALGWRLFDGSFSELGAHLVVED